MPIIDVNGRKTHYQELNPQGRETVLLIHGMLGNLSVWYFHIAPQLACHFRVIMYDLKSHGLSGRVAEGYDLTTMTDDLLALLDMLRLDTIHLAGYSFGGLIALKAAIRFPARIKTLSIIEGPDPSDAQPIEMMNKYSREALADYAAGLTDILGKKISRRQLDRNHRLYEYLFHETSIRVDMEKERDFFATDNIESIQHPTLLIYGNQSDCIAAGETLAHTIHNAALILTTGGHDLPIRHPDAIAHYLNQFFTTEKIMGSWENTVLSSRP